MNTVSHVHPPNRNDLSPDELGACKPKVAAFNSYGLQKMNSSTSKSQEILVFLSSTFKDMEAERNHLTKHIFPKIRTLCLERQVGFTEIDLRWGITEEESKNGATIEICLAEIDRCRDFPPFFIGFLGDRYGWIPRYEDMTAYWDTRESARKRQLDIEQIPDDSLVQRGLENDELRYEQRIRTAVAQGISVTELEMELAVLAKGASNKLQGHALFLLRDRTLTDSLYQTETGNAANPADTNYYDAAGDKLSKLKERLRASPFLGIDGYTSIEQFGQAIENYLFDQINQQFPAENKPDNPQIRNAAHATFRNQRMQNFLPRDDVRQALVTAIEQRREPGDYAPILLAGPSGQGKSAILADLACHLDSLAGYRVIDHYIGADEDNSLDGWVHRVLRTLQPVTAGVIPESPDERADALANWLIIAGDRHQCRYILILDGLDQLDDGGKDIRLLIRNHIARGAIVIASAADHTTAMDSAIALKLDIRAVPPLNDGLRESLIEETLLRYRKKLPLELVGKLAAVPQSGSPLYLTLALEKLRLDANHESLTKNLDDILAQLDAEHLFLRGFLLDRDYGRPEQPDLALEFMALLAASQNGLTEYELAGMLALPTDPKSEESGMPKLPQVYLSQLLAVFQPFLLSKQGNRSPMHSVLVKTSLDTYGDDKARRKIVDYFELEWQSSRCLDRVAIELVGQLWVLRDDKKLNATLIDPRVAIRIIKRNPYQFSRYWIEVVRKNGESAQHAEILIRKLIKAQEDTQTDWAARTAESLLLANAFLSADETDCARRIYHGIILQSKMPGGQVSVDTFKDSLRGLVKCFLTPSIDVTDMTGFEELTKHRDDAVDWMGDLLHITKADSCIERAEDALLLSELHERNGHLTDTTNEAEELQTKDIDNALEILDEEDCVHSRLFHTTKSKAYKMALRAQVDSIARYWKTPEIRNRMIDQTLEKSKNYLDYMEQHLLIGHQHRVQFFECIHTLYSQAALAAKDTQSPRVLWLEAVEYAWKTINELEKSCLFADGHDFILLNAAETISLALETGCPVEKDIVNTLLERTSGESRHGMKNDGMRKFAEEIHNRLLRFGMQ